jgi:sulfatase modifying factor 1
MNTSPLEFLAEQMGNVVKYDQNGNPSIFVPFPKMNSKDLDASLPDRTHPAFIVNGQTVDRILIGKYLASELTAEGPLYSLPNMPPIHSLGADELDQRIRMFPGACSMTIAMHGLILLLAKKNGWVPKGNTYFSVDHRDGTPWDTGQSYVVSNKRVLYGWEYECIMAHTSVAELKPDIAPKYWKKNKFIGGSTVPGQRGSEKGRGWLTLTGTGPASWNLDGTPDSINDPIGNTMENMPGFRVFDGELQIFANNDAAHPDADNSSSSGAWKAILPSAVDDSHTLVAPGTAGTLKWNKNGAGNSPPQLDTQITLRCVDSEYMHTPFKDLTANTTRVPRIPAILRELGIMPIPGDTTEGRVYYRNHTNTEYLPRRGGHCWYTSGAGLGCVHSYNARGRALVLYGARPAFVEL